MNFDNPTTSIRQLIGECRDQWAAVGEGKLDLIWHPREGLDVFDIVFDQSMREHVTYLYLTADSGETCEGEVTLPLKPDSWRYFDTKHETCHEIDFFDYISRRAAAFVISHCRHTFEPSLAEGALPDQAAPKVWWVAYLWSLFGCGPETKSDQKQLRLDNILYLTIQALRQFDDDVTSPVAPSIKLKRSRPEEVQNREGSELSSEFWDQGRPQQRKILRFVLDNGGRTTRQKLEDSDGIFKEPPPSEATLRKALNRVNDDLEMHASGWTLEWSQELMDQKAEVWLTHQPAPRLNQD